MTAAFSVDFVSLTVDFVLLPANLAVLPIDFASLPGASLTSSHCRPTVVLLLDFATPILVTSC